MATRGAVRHFPNALTLLRLCVIPFFAVLLWRADGGRSIAAGALFAIASLTDWFDGYLARRLQVQSRFGRLADPLADRLLIASAVLILWHHGRIGFVVVALILGRDLVLLSGFGIVAERGYELSVVYVGKAATFVLMAGLWLVMLTRRGTTLPTIVLYFGIALSLTAGVVYVVSVRQRMRGDRTAGA